MQGTRGQTDFLYQHPKQQSQRHPQTPSTNTGTATRRGRSRTAQAPRRKRSALRRKKDSPNQNHPINHQQTPSPAGRERAGVRARRGGARRTPSPRISKQPQPNPTNPPQIPQIPIQTKQQKSSKSFQIMKIMVQKQLIPPNPTPETHVLRNPQESPRNHLTTRISMLHLWLRMNSDMRRDDGCGNPSPRGHRG